MKINYKRILSLIAAVILVLSLAACADSSTSQDSSSGSVTSETTADSNSESASSEATNYEPVTLRVAYMPNFNSASSLFTAIENRYFEEVGITVEPYEFQGGPAEIAAMSSGDIDIAQIGHGAHVLCIQGEAVVFQFDQNGLADAVVANKTKGISSITDLKGKTVAVQSGTSSEIILQLALEDAGMSMDDIKTVEMDANGMVTAMVSGRIDACATWSPSTLSIEKGLGENYLVLATNKDFMDRASFASSFITTKDYADKNPEVLARFAAAINKAQVYRVDHLDEVAEMLAEKLNVPKDAMLQSTGEGDFQGAVDCIGDMDTIKAYYQSQQNIFLMTGAIDKEVPVENYVLFDIMQKGYDIYQTIK